MASYRTRTQWGLSSDIQDWRDQAACRPGSGVDPEVFFTDGNGAPSLLKLDIAKQICGRCPVARQCLKWAVGNGIDWGVWGGKTPGERRGTGLEYQTNRWCQRCREAYAWDAANPYARICPACSAARVVA